MVNKDDNYIALVKLAQQGNRESMDQLVPLVEGRIRAYIYRVTLDEELSKDLTQDTLLAMFESLGTLKKVESFWPWLFRVATSKIQQHYRQLVRVPGEKTFTLEDALLERCCRDYEDQGLNNMVRKELAQTIVSTMKRLKPHQRAVLSLRCFEDMAYTEVAETMQCSELNARVNFFRAKKTLQKHLSRRGFSKATLLLALGMFGKLTAPAAASQATSVPAGATGGVGITGSLAGWVGTQTGAVVTTLAVITLVSTGIMGWKQYRPEPTSLLTNDNHITSVHYTSQSRQILEDGPCSLSKGAYEQWYYWSEYSRQAMYFRMQRWDPQQNYKMCSWLQNGQGNYYFHSGQQKVYINNSRLWRSSLSVRRLATDASDFTEFMDHMDGGTAAGVKYDRDEQTGFIVKVTDNRFVDVQNFTCNYDYNTLQESFFDYDNWIGDVEIVDMRDAMHKRGWTYFHIDGQIGGETVRGQGRIAFVYDAYREHPDWLKMEIGDRLIITDGPGGGRLQCPGGPTNVYPAGSFFKGLARPWTGMHTIDTIRRDAAEKRVYFKTTTSEDNEFVSITLAEKVGYSQQVLEYIVDMENDLIRTIVFPDTGRAGPAVDGKVIFTYLDEVDQAGNEFIEPASSPPAETISQPGMGILWLIQLAQGKLGPSNEDQLNQVHNIKPTGAMAKSEFIIAER